MHDNETLPSYFENISGLKDSQVINYATPGYGVDHMIESYEYYNRYFRRDDVFVMVLIENDFVRPMVSIKSQKSSLSYLFWNIERHSSFLSHLYIKSGPIFYAIKEKTGVQPQKETQPLN